MKHVTAFLVTLLLALSCTACGGEDTLIGSWEGPLEVSILGEGIEEAKTSEGSILLTFGENNSAGLLYFPGPDLPVQDAILLQYTTEGDQLTLTFDSGQTMVFTYHLDGDTLNLDGRADLTLTRAEPSEFP